MVMLRCLLDIQEELSNRQLWIEEAQSAERSVLHVNLERLQMYSVLLVFKFIGLDEITMEVCRQRSSPGAEPRHTSSMGCWRDREEPARRVLPDK